MALSRSRTTPRLPCVQSRETRATLQVWLCRLQETILCLARGNSQLLNIIIHEYLVVGDVQMFGVF